MPTQKQVDEDFIERAFHNAAKSKCCRRSVGAVLALYDVLLGDGRNGTPRGIQNCTEGGCPRCSDTTIASGQDLDKCICIHAEKNAIFSAYIKGAMLDIRPGLYDASNLYRGPIMYITTSPCLGCTADMIQIGIRRIVYIDSYPGVEEVSKLFSEAKILFEQYPLQSKLKKSLLNLLKKS